jgi:hypothetical protein
MRTQYLTVTLTKRQISLIHAMLGFATSGDIEDVFCGMRVGEIELERLAQALSDTQPVEKKRNANAK